MTTVAVNVVVELSGTGVGIPVLVNLAAGRFSAAAPSQPALVKIRTSPSAPLLGSVPLTKGVLLLAGLGGLVAVITGFGSAGGAPPSTVKLRLAGAASAFPAGSVALTSKTCGPEPRSLAGVWVLPGPEQGPKAAASKRHWKLAPGSEEKP